MSVISGMIDHIKNVGWYQGSYWDPMCGVNPVEEVSCCLLGAYHVITNTNTGQWQCPETTAIAEVIAEQFDDRIGTETDVFDVITEFNDNTYTTLEDVLLVLEKAKVSTHDGL